MAQITRHVKMMKKVGDLKQGRTNFLQNFTL